MAPAETEGDEFSELDSDPLEVEDDEPEAFKPPRARQEPKPGRPKREGWVAEHKRDQKSKGKRKDDTSDEEDSAPTEPLPPLTEDILSIVDTVAVFPLILASQMLSTPEKPLVYHNEGIRQIKQAARKYVKYRWEQVRNAPTWAGRLAMSPEMLVVYAYGICIAGAYFRQSGAGPQPNAAKTGKSSTQEAAAAAAAREVKSNGEPVTTVRIVSF